MNPFSHAVPDRWKSLTRTRSEAHPVARWVPGGKKIISLEMFVEPIGTCLTKKECTEIDISDKLNRSGNLCKIKMLYSYVSFLFVCFCGIHWFGAVEWIPQPSSFWERGMSDDCLHCKGYSVPVTL